MKIIITGGHLTPAYAFAEYARQQGDELVMIGSAGPQSTEAKELKELQVPYKQIYPVKFDRNHQYRSYIRLPLLSVPFFQSMRYLSSLKPDIAVTFGSFNALPVAWAAMCQKIPFIIHEQTRSLGLTNSLLSSFCAAQAVSYEETKRNAVKHEVTGNLLRQVIWNPPQHSPLSLPTEKPILYITGGNQGSSAINHALLPALNQLSNSYQVVLQSGKTSIDISQISQKVIVKPWFSVQEAAWLLHHAHIIISRGGANTISEIMVAGTPALTIPLPNTTNDEQTKNAHLLSDRKAGLVLPQTELSTQAVLDNLRCIESDYKNIVENAQQLRALQHPDAVKKLYRLAHDAT